MFENMRVSSCSGGWQHPTAGDAAADGRGVWPEGEKPVAAPEHQEPSAAADQSHLWRHYQQVSSPPNPRREHFDKSSSLTFILLSLQENSRSCRLFDVTRAGGRICQEVQVLSHLSPQKSLVGLMKLVITLFPSD